MHKNIQHEDVTELLILKAQDEPLDGIDNPAPNLRYRFPRLERQQRRLGSLSEHAIRVEMAYVGICGTDIHLLEFDPRSGYVRTSAPASIPESGRVIGHEGVGRIVAVGAQVVHVKPGDFVAFASVNSCFHCDTCRRGDFNQCTNALLLGMQQDGLFGTIVDVPASLAHDVTAYVFGEDDLRAFACLEPASTAMLACETANIKPGDCVTIFGGGPIGLYCALIAKRIMGAAKVHVVEPEPVRRAMVVEWCDAVFDVEEYLSIRQDAIDVVIEASGAMENVSRIFDRIRPNGRVVLLARSGAALILDKIDHMITQAIQISGSRGHLGGSIARVIALYQSGVLPLLAPVSKTLESMAELSDMLSDAGSLSAKHCKVLARLGR